MAATNLIPKPGLEINSLEGWSTHFPMRLSSTMGFIFWSSILVGNPIHDLKTPKRIPERRTIFAVGSKMAKLA